MTEKRLIYCDGGKQAGHVTSAQDRPGGHPLFAVLENGAVEVYNKNGTQITVMPALGSCIRTICKCGASERYAILDKSKLLRVS